MNPIRVPVLAAALILTGCATVHVTHVPGPASPMAAKPSNRGVFYALPKTVLRVAVTVEKNDRHAAPFMEYAGIFAPGGKPVCKTPTCAEEKPTTYDLKSETTFDSYGTPDPDQVYMVEITGGRTVDQTLGLTWNDTGLLSNASSEVTNRTTDFVTSVLGFAGGVGARLGFAAGASKAPGPQATGKPKGPSCFDAGINDDKFLDVLKDSPTLVGNYCAIPKDKRDKLTFDEDKLKAALQAYTQQVRNSLRNAIAFSAAGHKFTIRLV